MVRRMDKKSPSLRSRWFAAQVIVLSSLSLGAHAQTYDPYAILSQFNLIVPGNLAVYNDTEGRVVAGTLTTYDLNGTTFGTNALYGGGTGIRAVVGTATLTDTSTNAVTTFGTLNVNTINPGVTAVTTAVGNLNYGTNLSTATPVANGTVVQTTTNITPFVTALNGLQTSLGNLTATPTATATLAGGTLTFSLGTSATAVVVLNINASTLNGTNAITFTGLAGSVVINVINNGNVNTTINANSFVFGTTGVTSKQLIWNFGNISTIALNGEWQGTILAGDATVTDTLGSDIEGVVYAQNLYTGMEVHNFTYTPPTNPTTPSTPTPPPTPTPEPGTMALLASGLAGIAALRRRRKV